MSSRLNRSLAALFAPPVQKLRRLLGIETLVEHNLRMQDEMREEMRRVTQISMDTSVIMASIASTRSSGVATWPLANKSFIKRSFQPVDGQIKPARSMPRCAPAETESDTTTTASIVQYGR
jgi:hypothetical protein